MNIEDNRSFFNEKAENWDNTVYHAPEKIRFLLGRLKLAADDRVLDVGTGTGVLLPYLFELVGPEGRITAIDIAENMIEKARTKYAGFPIEFIVGDATFLAKPPETYDAVVCYSVFPHFVDPKVTLSSLAKMLKPQGRLIICHSQSKERINRRHQELGKSLISRPLPPSSEVVRLLEEVGLKVRDSAERDEYYYVLGVR